MYRILFWLVVLSVGYVLVSSLIKILQITTVLHQNTFEMELLQALGPKSAQSLNSSGSPSQTWWHQLFFHPQLSSIDQ